MLQNMKQKFSESKNRCQKLRAKLFEMMNQQSIKSEADLRKRKNLAIQSRAIERDTCDDVLYQQHR